MTRSERDLPITFFLADTQKVITSGKQVVSVANIKCTKVQLSIEIGQKTQ